MPPSTQFLCTFTSRSRLPIIPQALYFFRISHSMSSTRRSGASAATAAATESPTTTQTTNSSDVAVEQKALVGPTPSTSSSPSTTAETSSSASTASSSSTSTGAPPSQPPTVRRQESSARSAILRLASDYQAILNEANDGCSASPISEDNMFVWKACIFGPPDSPWEGGVFQLRMQFTKDYPQTPPTVQFVSRMFHPNIYKDGALCLDIIQNKWSPVYTVSTILTSIQSLLQDPNPNSPANPDAAKLWSTDRKAYNKLVRQCVASQ